jgi:hypothetical protein
MRVKKSSNMFRSSADTSAATVYQIAGLAVLWSRGPGSILNYALSTLLYLLYRPTALLRRGGGAPPQLFTDKSVYVYSELCVVKVIRYTVASLGPLPIRV